MSIYMGGQTINCVFVKRIDGSTIGCATNNSAASSCALIGSTRLRFPERRASP